MELTDDQLFTKIKEQAFLEDLLCIDDFIEIHQSKAIMNMEPMRKKEHIQHFIDNKIKPFLQNGDQFKDFSVKGYGELTEDIKETKPGSVEFPKYYLIKNNVRVEFITNVNDFLKQFYSNYRNKSLQKVVDKENELEKNSIISRMNKNEKITITEDAVYTELQSFLKYIYYRGHDSVNYSLLPSIYRESYINFEPILEKDIVIGLTISDVNDVRLQTKLDFC